MIEREDGEGIPGGGGDRACVETARSHIRRLNRRSILDMSFVTSNEKK